MGNCNSVNSGKKKTCASAQVGVIEWSTLWATSPINTSGTIRLATRVTRSPADIRNSISQSVSKRLNIPV